MKMELEVQFPFQSIEGLDVRILPQDLLESEAAATATHLGLNRTVAPLHDEAQMIVPLHHSMEHAHVPAPHRRHTKPLELPLHPIAVRHVHHPYPPHHHLVPTPFRPPHLTRPPLRFAPDPLDQPQLVIRTQTPGQSRAATSTARASRRCRWRRFRLRFFVVGDIVVVGGEDGEERVVLGEGEDGVADGGHVAALRAGEGVLGCGQGGGENVGEAVLAEGVAALEQEGRVGVVVVGRVAD